MNAERLCPGNDFVFVNHAIYEKYFSPLSPCPTVALYRKGTKRTDWTTMELFVQSKRHEYQDPYHHEFTLDDTTTPSDTSVEAQKQLLQFAAFQWNHQHRLFAFAVGIYDSRARFFRFDPSSVAVSESFNYRDEPRLLAEFFLRYSTLSPVERGFDPTVTPATGAERELYCSHLKNYLQRVEEKNLRMYPHVERLLAQNVPVFKIQVNDLDGGVHWYLGSSPAIAIAHARLNSAPCGRLTRGYIATPISPTEKSEKGKLYWLKDCWRSIRGDSETEKYSHLKNTGVPNLPELLCGGDVLTDDELQETENDSLVRYHGVSWTSPASPLQHMVHHRLVQGLLIPLWYVESAKELLRAGRDALESRCSKFVLKICLTFRVYSDHCCVLQVRHAPSRRQRRQRDVDRSQERWVGEVRYS